MNIGVISNRYAKALYQYAAEGQCEKQVYREMMTLADSYLQVPALRKALDNPLLSVAEKTDLLCNACGGKVSPQTKRFSCWSLQSTVRSSCSSWLLLT